MIVNLKSRAADYFERTDTLVRYYEDIRRYQLLSLEEEAELFNLLKYGNNEEKKYARSKIINSNQRFVVAIAKKFGTNDNILDLISEGNIGLMEAIDKFDITKGVKFSTFAVWYIRRAINLYNINHGTLVTKSNISKTYHVISQATNKFVQREFRQPTLEELKDLLVNEYNVDIKDAIDILDTRIVSIDDDGGDDSDDNTNVSDVIAYRSNSAYSNTYEKRAENDFNKELIQSMLNKLSKREQDIIKLIFGIDCDREYELQEVAKKVGLTTERVRQLKFSIIEKLKEEYKKVLNKI